MTTVFYITLESFLILSKCKGLIDILYTVKSTGFLVHKINLMFHIFLEITRLFILLICTYILIYKYGSELFILQAILVIKFWINIIAARLSNNWIIE